MPNPVQVTTLGVAVIGLGAFWYYYIRKKESFCKNLHRVPPMLQYWFRPEDSVKWFMHYMQNYGKIAILQEEPVPVVLVSDYKFAKFLLTSTKFVKKSERHLPCGLRPENLELITRSLETGLNRSIFIQHFLAKNRDRSLRIAELISNMLITKLQTRLPEKSINIFPLISICILDTLSEITMGKTSHVLLAMLMDRQPTTDSLSSLCLPVVINKLREGGVYVNEIQQLIFTNYNEYLRQVIMLLYHFMDQVIASRRQRRRVNQQRSRDETDNKKTFVDFLVDVSIEGQLTYEKILEEASVLLFDGAGPISTTISFALHCLAHHPEVQEKAAAEQGRIFKDLPNYEAKYSDLKQMDYLEMVINETLRLYPPMSIITKKADCDLYYDSKFIPKGSIFHVFPFGIHRSSNYHVKPDEFNPNRFNMKSIQSCAYMPFSVGSRKCIGEDFAMLQMKSVISKILRKFKLMPSIPQQPEEKLALNFCNVLNSANGICLRISPRDMS